MDSLKIIIIQIYVKKLKKKCIAHITWSRFYYKIFRRIEENNKTKIFYVIKLCRKNYKTKQKCSYTSPFNLGSMGI